MTPTSNQTCGSCEKGRNFKRVISARFQYLEIDIDNISLLDLAALECQECGFRSVIIPQIEDLHMTIAEALIRKPYRLKPKEMEFLRSQFRKITKVGGQKSLRYFSDDTIQWNLIYDQNYEVSDHADRDFRLKYICLMGLKTKSYHELQDLIFDLLHPKRNGISYFNFRFQNEKWIKEG